MTTSACPPAPRSPGWAKMAAECPAGRSAAAHCHPNADDQAWVHLVTKEGLLCVQGVRNRSAGGRCYLPDPMPADTRTSEAQRYAELVGRW